MRVNVLWGGAKPPFGTYQSRRVQTGGQRVKETIGGTLEVAEFDAAIKSAQDIRVEGTGSEELAARRRKGGALEQDMVCRVPPLSATWARPLSDTSRTKPLRSWERCS